MCMQVPPTGSSRGLKRACPDPVYVANSLPHDILRKIFNEVVRDCEGMRLVIPFLWNSCRHLQSAKPSSSCWTSLAEKGYLSVIQWALQRGAPCYQREAKEMAYAAAAQGRIPVLTFLNEKGVDFKDIIEISCADSHYKQKLQRIAHFAAKMGQLEVLQWLKQNQLLTSTYQSIAVAGAHGGHEAVIDWARREGDEDEVDNVAVMSYAAAGGHLELVKSIYEELGQPALDDRIARIAAREGRLSVIQWAFDKINFAYLHEVIEDICSTAAEGGHLSVIKWVYSQDHGPHGVDLHFTCGTAAEYGHTHILEWAWQTCPQDFQDEHLYEFSDLPHRPKDYYRFTDLCDYAACVGHLNVLQWGREKKFPWSDKICFHAAKYGYFDMLKWAKANGAFWNPQKCYATAAKALNKRNLVSSPEKFNKQIEILSWIQAQSPEIWGGDWCRFRPSVD